MKASIGEQFKKYDSETKTASDFAVECAIPKNLYENFIQTLPPVQINEEFKRESKT
jgi:hypothetical protein